MRCLIACTIVLAASACVAPQDDRSLNVVKNGEAVYAADDTTVAVPVGSTGTLNRAVTVSVAGCCSMIAPAGSVVTQPTGRVIDGFAATTISAAGETVTVQPLLGSYGWLNAESGTARIVDSRPAREAVLSGRRTIAIPLQTSIDGRTSQMTLRVTSDCPTVACPLMQSIVRSMQIEDRWSAQSRQRESSGNFRTQMNDRDLGGLLSDRYLDART